MASSTSPSSSAKLINSSPHDQLKRYFRSSMRICAPMTLELHSVHCFHLKNQAGWTCKRSCWFVYTHITSCVMHVARCYLSCDNAQSQTHNAKDPIMHWQCVLVTRYHNLGLSNDNCQGFMFYNFVMMLLFNRFHELVWKGARDNVTNFSWMTQVVHPLQRSEQCVPWIRRRIIYVYIIYIDRYIDI